MGLLLLMAAAAGSTTEPLQHASAPPQWPAFEPVVSVPGYFSSLGNHRFNVTIASQSWRLGPVRAVTVQVVWRRSDPEPLQKAVWVTAGANSSRGVACSIVGASTDSANITFTPVAGQDRYFIYYMPFTTCEYTGGACIYGARTTYDAPGATGSCTTRSTTVAQPIGPGVFSAATVVYEARTPFESFEPMEMPMTAPELARFYAARHDAGRYHVVTETRDHPVRMRKLLPFRWIASPVAPAVDAKVQPGEHYTFQLVVINSSPTTLEITDVAFTALRGPAAATIPSKAFVCMNMGGSDFWGRDYRLGSVAIANGTVLSMWVAVQIPTNAPTGKYSGTATVAVAGEPTTTVSIVLSVSGPVLSHGGDDEVSRGTRLLWLNSKIGLSDDAVVPFPYVPIAVTTAALGAETSITMLGKQITIGRSGLLRQAIVTLDSMQGAPGPPRSILDPASNGVEFAVDGTPLDLSAASLTVDSHSNRAVTWHSTIAAANGQATVSVAGSVDCTGYLLYNVSVTAVSALRDTDVQLRVPANPATAQFAMGLGRPGGHMAEWVSTPLPDQALHSWLVFDFGGMVHLDGFRLFGAGDSTNDVSEHYMQAQDDSGRWIVPVLGPYTGRKDCKVPQRFSFPPTLARIWRWVVTGVFPSPACVPYGSAYCQPTPREIEFHHFGTALEKYAKNNGSASASLIVGSSGSNAGGPWMAVDGNYTTVWDAALEPGPPDEPRPRISPGLDNASWRWDRQSGNNGVWIGNTKAGVRLNLKGEDPLWWAGSPYPNSSSPQPPASWANQKLGGMTTFQNGTTIAFTGPRSMEANETISYVFSLLITPVRPVNRTAQFQDRWAQLMGPANYTELAAMTINRVNMHQGNPINPWVRTHNLHLM